MTNRVVPTAKLTFGLLGHQVAAKKGPNPLVAGLSVSFCLGMVLNGAGGETRREMIEALGLEFGHNDDDNELNNEAYAAMIDSLTDEQLGVAFTVANFLYAKKGETRFVPQFLALSKQYFKATVKTLEFGQAAVDEINEDCKTATRGLIKEIIKKLEPLDVMVLLNCIYFKGNFRTKFDELLTDDATFHAPSGGRPHPTMFRHDHMRYLRTQTAVGVALPFGSTDDRFNLYTLLPANGASVEDVVESLTPDSLDALIEQRYQREVKLWLPKYKIAHGAKLNETLEALGMVKALNPGADLKGLIDADAYISTVEHKAALIVTELGAEAAGATQATATLECMSPPPVEVRVDNPFVTLIVDDATRTVAFAGVVNEPEKV